MLVAFVILLVLGAAITLNLHELSHCIVVWAAGGKVTSYKPYPHFVGSNFKFGRMTYEGGKWDRVARINMNAAPLFKADTLLVLYFILGLLCWPFFALAFWELTDVINWVQGYIRERDNDGGRCRAIMEEE